MWFHPIGTAYGGSLSHGVRLWGGAEAKAFACLQADDGDVLGRRFPSWRHHSFAPSPVPPMACRLIGGSSVVPALLHSPCCRLGCLGRGGCFAALSRCPLMFADGGLLDLADALLLYFFSGGCFTVVIVLLGGCFATGSCFELGGCFAAILLL